MMCAEVLLENPIRGREKLLHMAASAVEECLSMSEVPPGEIPLLLCVAEEDRPGRMAGLDGAFLSKIYERLGVKLPLRVGGDRQWPHRRSAGGLPGAGTDRRGTTLLPRGRGGQLSDGRHAGSVRRTTPPADQCEFERFHSGRSRSGGVTWPCRQEPQGRIWPAWAWGWPGRQRPWNRRSRCGPTAWPPPSVLPWRMPVARSTIVDYRLTDCSGEQYGFKEASAGLGPHRQEVEGGV